MGIGTIIGMIVFGLLYIAISIGIFLLMRKVMLWYWRINEQMRLFENSIEEQKKLNEIQKEHNEIQRKMLAQFEKLNENIIQNSKVEKITKKSPQLQDSIEENKQEAFIAKSGTEIDLFKTELSSLVNENSNLKMFTYQPEEIVIKAYHKNKSDEIFKKFTILFCLSNLDIKTRIKNEFINLSEDLLRKEVELKENIYALAELERRKMED